MRRKGFSDAMCVISASTLPRDRLDLYYKCVSVYLLTVVKCYVALKSVYLCTHGLFLGNALFYFLKLNLVFSREHWWCRLRLQPRGSRHVGSSTPHPGNTTQTSVQRPSIWAHFLDTHGMKAGNSRDFHGRHRVNSTHLVYSLLGIESHQI